MFTVKATYRNETRKFSFSDQVLFPSYEELYHQLYRIFPISHNYYISRLIFSPDASKASRILIGKEVHTAEEYNTRIAPFRRHWPNPLLRFSIFDETPHKVPNSTLEDSQKTPSAPPFMAVPPPPIILSPPRHSFLDIQAPDSRAHVHSISQSGSPSSLPLPTPQIPLSFIPPPPSLLIPSQPQVPHACNRSGSPIDTPPRPCCSVAQGKSEIESLLFSFKKDLERIMRNTFGSEYASTAEVDTSDHRTAVPSLENPTAAPTSAEASYNPVYPSPDTASSRWCFVCRNEFSGSWYGCVKCPWHFVCPSCFSKSGAMHTFSFGPTHVVQQHGSGAVPPSTASVQPVPEVPAVPQSSITSPAVNTEHNQRQPVIHRNVACDNCKKAIVGIRHKCLDCPDYDLCTLCIQSGAAETHNPFHEFFDIETPGNMLVHTVFSGRGERAVSSASRPTSISRHRSSAATPLNVVEPIRHFAACNLCDSTIIGDRFKCVNCPDFDTCADCFKITREQHPNHGFVRVSKPSDLMMRNALTNKVTHRATCDSCKEIILGVRYKCMHPSCPDFDLCEDCEALPIAVHPPIHPLLKMKAADTVVPTAYRIGLTDPIQSREYCSHESNNISTQSCSPPKSPGTLVPTLCTAFEHSVSTQESFVASDSRTPVVTSVQCPEVSVDTNSVGPLDRDLTRIKLPQSSIELHLQSTSPRVCVPVGDLVETNNRPTATEVGPSPFDLGTSLDTFREIWPKVNREMKHLIEARQPEHDKSSPTAVSGKDIGTNLVDLEEETLLCTPTSPYRLPSMIELNGSPLLSANRDLSVLLNGYNTTSHITSEIPALSCTTLSALPDSSSDEQAVTPILKQQLPPLSCAFISDATVPDGQIFPPGAEFVKSWRMLNDGETPWPETTELHFVAGESFAPSICISTVSKVGCVNPGESLDVWTGELKAPDAPGRYVSYWKLKDGKGESFGANIWIDITVAEPHQPVDLETSDQSLASSLMVMPNSTSNQSSVPSTGAGFGSMLGHLYEPPSPSASKPATEVTDDADSDSSSVSLISVPSYEDYESEWQDAHSQGENLEYVVLYDSNGSESE